MVNIIKWNAAANVHPVLGIKCVVWTAGFFSMSPMCPSKSLRRVDILFWKCSGAYVIPKGNNIFQRGYEGSQLSEFLISEIYHNPELQSRLKKTFAPATNQYLFHCRDCV